MKALQIAILLFSCGVASAAESLDELEARMRAEGITLHRTDRRRFVPRHVDVQRDSTCEQLPDLQSKDNWNGTVVKEGAPKGKITYNALYRAPLTPDSKTPEDDAAQLATIKSQVTKTLEDLTDRAGEIQRQAYEDARVNDEKAYEEYQAKKKSEEDSKKGAVIFFGWNANQMPFGWLNMSKAWAKPIDYSGMMTTRGGVYVVTEDYVPLVAEVETVSQACEDLLDGIKKLEPHKKTVAMKIYNTVAQMDEAKCTNVPNWARDFYDEMAKEMEE